MANVKISALPEATQVTNSDYTVIDDGVTTKKIAGETLVENLIPTEKVIINSHAITRQSTNGAYYSQTEIDVTKTGYEAVGCLIKEWSGISAVIQPYITESNKLGFLSDVSQTVAYIVVIIIYKKQ